MVPVGPTLPDINSSFATEGMIRATTISDEVAYESKKKFINDLLSATAISEELDNPIEEFIKKAYSFEEKPIIIQGREMPRRMHTKYTGKFIQFVYGDEVIIYHIYKREMSEQLVFIRNIPIDNYKEKRYPMEA